LNHFSFSKRSFKDNSQRYIWSFKWYWNWDDQKNNCGSKDRKLHVWVVIPIMKGLYYKS